MRRRRALLCALLAAGALAAPAQAVESREWELTSVEDFLAGDFDGVILEYPGTLRVGLEEQSTAIDASQVWSVVQDRRGVLYVGTGNEGRVFKVRPDGSEEVIIDLDGSQVYALAARGNDVFAATSPGGAVYRLTADGRAEEWYRPAAIYIWALLVGADDALYAATGSPATVVRITGPGKGEVVYESTAEHLVSLARTADGALLAGTGDTGVVLQLDAGGKGPARVVYDAPFEEIRSILPAPDGGMYFIAVQSQPGAAKAAAGLKLGGLTGDDDDDDKNGNNNKAAQAAAAQMARGAAASALYRVEADGRVDPLWTGKGQRVYSAVLLGEDVLFGTDQQGTVFRLTPEGVPAVIYRGRHDKVVAMAPGAEGQVLLGTAEAASVVRLGPKPPDAAAYTSAVQDAMTFARFGQVRWAASGGRGPTLRLRSGNTREPDDRWTAWSEPARETTPAGAVADGRFLQFRLDWAGRDRSAAVTGVHVPFAQRNLAPRVLKIAFEIKGRMQPAGANVGAESDAAALQALLKRYNNGNGNKKENGDDAAHASTVKVTWKALDPNGDTLEYTLYFRGTGETLWKELETELDKAEYEWDSLLVPDGWYALRVVATDKPSNAVGDAIAAELISEPVLVDNTGPVIEAIRVAGGRDGSVTVKTSVTDALLPLRQGRYSLDGQPWVWFAPDDGIFDSTQEAVTIQFDALAPGEHTVAVQVLDAARNIGSRKGVFTVD